MLYLKVARGKYCSHLKKLNNCSLHYKRITPDTFYEYISNSQDNFSSSRKLFEMAIFGLNNTSIQSACQLI